MSREIKFRAWDTKAKKWCGYEDTGHIIDLNHSIRRNAFMVDNDVYDFPRELELSQYTGLKDKNGVEIYEGDILKYRRANPDTETFEDRFSPVEFSDGWFDTPYGGLSLRLMAGDVEVAGNIYEDSDLLEASHG